MAEAKKQDNEATKNAQDQAKTEEPRKLDETVPGGRYVVDGRLVDANGKPLKEEGK